jgi:phosphoribosylformylglycinamidine synthase
MPDTGALKDNWSFLGKAIEEGKVVSAWSCGFGGVAEALVKMALGNGLGFIADLAEDELFALKYGSAVIEATVPLDHTSAVRIGEVTDGLVAVNGVRLSLDELAKAYESRYWKIYPPKVEPLFNAPVPEVENLGASKPVPEWHGERVEHPIVCLPVFPGTNCDYDTAKAFIDAGAEVRPFVFRNLSPEDVLKSIDTLAGLIRESHILALCGGFSSGDEPDGSGKFIANVLCNSKVSEAIDSLRERGGLILGICNGFQALVKSGLLPYGRTGTVTPGSPTLFRNDINRHISLIARTEVVSVHSPWMAGFTPGERHSIAFSHGEGKFTVSPDLAKDLFARGQVAFRYVDNPNGSHYGIEGILSPDGLILGKMGHSERYEENLMKNIAGNRLQPLFRNAVSYFRKTL